MCAPYICKGEYLQAVLDECFETIGSWNGFHSELVPGVTAAVSYLSIGKALRPPTCPEAF